MSLMLGRIQFVKGLPEAHGNKDVETHNALMTSFIKHAHVGAVEFHSRAINILGC